MLSFARQSYVRRRYPTDAEGYPDFDQPPSEITILRASIQPGASTEVLDQREAEKVAFTVYQSPGYDVTARDFAVYEGVMYRIAGEPQRWIGPTDATSHDLVLFERWEG
jgi:hypothetical protein